MVANASYIGSSNSTYIKKKWLPSPLTSNAVNCFPSSTGVNIINYCHCSCIFCAKKLVNKEAIAFVDGKTELIRQLRIHVFAIRLLKFSEHLLTRAEDEGRFARISFIGVRIDTLTNM
ncbi:hypothetical protein HW555_011885 [Spodoptera exigua]|uniref:Uncharacterized protein n=1 Tax=Spodoptera exigua TaxID=7107 RepID=A0A835KZK2_SPOEX|nr:hypothetical protein HW555_011885 [Spodoptera exigua]